MNDYRRKIITFYEQNNVFQGKISNYL